MTGGHGLITTLDNLDHTLSQRGYTFLRAPRSDQLPAFFDNLTPDAVAVGRTPALAFELVERPKASGEKVRRLRDLLDGNNDWQLEVISLPAGSPPLDAASPHEIKSAIDRARHLVEAEPRAAILLAWAALEAVGRRLEPQLAAQKMTAGSLIDLLVSNSHMSQEDGAALQDVARVRNAVAHGQFGDVPNEAALIGLLATAERLLQNVEETSSGP